MEYVETEFGRQLREMRHERERKALLEQGLELDDEGNPVEPEPKFSVTVPGHEVPIAELPTSPKKYMVRLEKNAGWIAKGQHSRTHHEATVYAADSKKKPGQEQPDHRKGDPQTPEQDKDHWSVQAILVGEGVVYAHLWAQWITVKGKTTFMWAKFWDRFEEEREMVVRTGDFEEWLGILAPIGAPKPKAEKVEIEQDELAPLRAELESGEWTG